MIYRYFYIFIPCFVTRETKLMTIASTITLPVDYDEKFRILLLTRLLFDFLLKLVYDEETQQRHKYNRLSKNNFFLWKVHEKLCGQVDATVGSKME